MQIGRLIEGLQIIARHVGDDAFSVDAEHDILYAGGTELPLTETEKARMTELGCFEDDDVERWAAYT